MLRFCEHCGGVSLGLIECGPTQSRGSVGAGLPAKAVSRFAQGLRAFSPASRLLRFQGVVPLAATRHIAAIAQRNGADQYPLLQHRGITGEVGTGALDGRFVPHVGRGLGIEQQDRTF